jgi:hypothetical protein
LLKVLEKAVPRVLILSTNFLPAILYIEWMLKHRKTTLVLLAEENDPTDYLHWMGAQGIVYRSTNEPALVDAVRRVARCSCRNPPPINVATEYKRRQSEEITNA